MSDKFPLNRNLLPNYEYLWRLHCQKELCFCQKYFSDSWKMAFFKCRKNWKRLSLKEEFDFKCSNFRPFKNYIDLLEQYQNFIFATD